MMADYMIHSSTEEEARQHRKLVAEALADRPHSLAPPLPMAFWDSARQPAATERDGDGMPLPPPAPDRIEWQTPLRVAGTVPEIPGVILTTWREGDPCFAPASPIREAISVDEVRAETERRLMLAFGARDAQHLTIKVQDSMIRANQLTDRLVQGDTLSAEDEAVAAYLRQAVRVYFAIKATGNSYEQAAAAGAIRPDWRDNANWPLVGEGA